MGHAQQTIVCAVVVAIVIVVVVVVSLCGDVDFGEGNVCDELGNVGVDAGFHAGANLEGLEAYCVDGDAVDEGLKGDADAGLDAEDGFEEHVAVADLYGEECEPTTVTAVDTLLEM